MIPRPSGCLLVTPFQCPRGREQLTRAALPGPLARRSGRQGSQCPLVLGTSCLYFPFFALRVSSLGVHTVPVEVGATVDLGEGRLGCCREKGNFLGSCGGFSNSAERGWPRRVISALFCWGKVQVAGCWVFSLHVQEPLSLWPRLPQNPCSPWEERGGEGMAWTGPSSSGSGPCCPGPGQGKRSSKCPRDFKKRSRKA